MIRLSGRTQLTCVQGDTFAIRIRVRLGLDKIKSLEFICSELGIEEPFLDDNHTLVNGKVDKGYLFKMDSETTASLPPCITDYSIRVNYIDGTVKTVTYRQSFTILERRK